MGGPARLAGRACALEDLSHGIHFIGGIDAQEHGLQAHLIKHRTGFTKVRQLLDAGSASVRPKGDQDRPPRSFRATGNDSKELTGLTVKAYYL
jgi:hypothetical protein